MRNPFAALIERKDDGGVWSGPLGSLIAAYVRDGMSGAPVSPDQAMRVAAVLSCVSLIAQNAAALPLLMYRRLPPRPGGLSGGKQRLPPTDPVVHILDQPNPWQTGQDWREQMTAHLLLRGNAFAWVSWGQRMVQGGGLADAPLLVVPLPPDKMEVVPLVDSAGRLTGRAYFLHRDSGERVPLPTEEVFHLPGLAWNGITGRSVLSDARETIGVALTTQQYAGRLFENDATPGVVLSHPKTLTEPAAKRLREQWDAEHRGHARKTAVLEEGMKIDRLTLTAEDAQFLETRKFQRAEIAGLFRVPPHLIGDVDRSTSWGTGIEQQQIAFTQYTLLPWLKKWENTVRRVLIVKDRELFAEHAVEGFLRGDAPTRGAFYTQMVTLGIFTRNEVRELENRNPLDGLDEPLTPLNMSTSGAPAPSDPGKAA